MTHTPSPCGLRVSWGTSTYLHSHCYLHHRRLSCGISCLCHVQFSDSRRLRVAVSGILLLPGTALLLLPLSFCLACCSTWADAVLLMVTLLLAAAATALMVRIRGRLRMWVFMRHASPAAHGIVILYPVRYAALCPVLPLCVPLEYDQIHD